jgi:hypothetical protein
MTMLAAIFGTYFGGWILFLRTRIKIPAFKGIIKEETLGDFIDFIYKNEDKVFFIDINLEEEQMEEINRDMQFTYKESSIPTSEHTFNFQKCSDELFIDSRSSSNRIKGYFKIVCLSGPHTGGIWLYKFKDVLIEKHWMHKHKKYKPKKKL